MEIDMKHMKLTALAAVLAAMAASPAMAQKVSTNGGIRIQSDDGNFEGRLGARIHWDTNNFVDDDDAPQTGGSFFRRARLTFRGKAYGWDYIFENDFAGQSGTNGSGFRDMNISRTVGPGKLIIGQFKPFRGMEEMTSSNEISFMERPVTTATGIYTNQFQMGLGYTGTVESFGYGVFVQNLRPAGADSGRTEGMSYGGRGWFTPVNNDQTVLHLGLSASIDNARENSNLATSSNQAVGVGSIRYSGRQGPSQGFGLSGPGEDATNMAIELAGRSGPFYAQAEYAQVSMSQVAASDTDVTAYHVQFTFMATGESKPYNMSGGRFGSPAPKGSMGAVELGLRYEYIENDDIAGEPEVSILTAGVNWYLNPNLRFMFNYVMGEAEVSGNKTSIDNFTTRVQWAF
jgi:phosphate-selective porin OprO/OprP